MATIKHPDTYTCDICGDPFDYKNKVSMPILFDKEEYEYGTLKIDEPKIKVVEIDICKECMNKALKVRGTYGFYRPDIYRIEE